MTINDPIHQLKVSLSQVVQRAADIKQAQAFQALRWARDHIPTPLAERLKLEHELTEVKSERAALEAKIILEQAVVKPKEAHPYYSQLCGHLIRVCTEAGRDDLVELAKQRRKEEEEK